MWRQRRKYLISLVKRTGQFPRSHRRINNATARNCSPVGLAHAYTIVKGTSSHRANVLPCRGRQRELRGLIAVQK
ncbi:uncharacterized protein [Anabrus simplex]|uniref:uncharacterized protein isoform X2 n=1 Tax=Anabrus simplex TaxID=316456 RepID=UPI0035A36152